MLRSRTIVLLVVVGLLSQNFSAYLAQSKPAIDKVPTQSSGPIKSTRDKISQAPSEVNLFRTRPAFQSDTYQNYIATNANDGDLNTVAAPGGGLPRWWYVDLGAPTRIDRVRIVQLGAPDCHAITGLHIQSSNNATAWEDQRLAAGTASSGADITYNFTPSGEFRYWQILAEMTYGPGCGLWLKEVEGYDTGILPPAPGPNTNQFLNEPSTQTETYPQFYPTYANDGLTSTHAAPGLVPVPLWWRVDMGAPTTINRIRIVQDPVPDCHAITELLIQGSMNDSSWVDQYHGTAPYTSVGSRTYDFSPTGSFRYWRILALHVYDESCGLTLREIEGYNTGQALPTPGPTTNLFLNKAAFQTAASSGNFAGYANDGYANTYGLPAGSSPPRWWYVDLGPNTTAGVDRIRILQEGHPSCTAISDLYIQASNTTSPTSWIDQYHVTGQSAWTADTMHAFWPTGSYRYWRVYAAANVGSSCGLKLYEVEGYSTGEPPPNTPTNTPTRTNTPTITSTPTRTNTPTPTPIGVASNEIRCGGNPSMHSSTASAGDLIDTANGNLCHAFTDITIPGRGVPLMFARTYNSLDADRPGPLGYGWTHSYNMFIERDQAYNYLVHQENGSVVTFGPDFSHPARVLATLAQVNGEHVFTRLHGQTRFYFKAVGPITPGNPGPLKLDRIVDRNNYTTTLSYDANGRLEKVTEPAGPAGSAARRTLEITYDSPESELIYEVIDAAGRRLVQFSYDNDRLYGAKDVGEQWTHYTYYDQNLIRTVVIPNDGVIIDYYDEFNRGIKQRDPETREIELSYTSLGSGNTQTRITDTLGLVTLHDYNLNKLTKVTQYPGGSIPAEWEYSYDPTLGTTRVEDPLDHPWTATWDASGNMTSSTDPISRTELYTYTPQNDLKMVTNAAGLTTTFAYDAKGNPLSIERKWVEQNQAVRTTFTYDKKVAGDVLTITNPLGKEWGYKYDIYGYVITTTDPLGNATRYVNDNVGRVTSLTDPRLNTTTYDYNNYNELILSIDPLYHQTVYTYDEIGNLRYVTDPKGNTITNTYNLNGELERVTQADGTHTDYEYDKAGRVLTQTNPLYEDTTYKYEDVKRRVTVTDPLIRKTTYEYDKVGNLKKVRQPGTGSPTITYNYDSAGQLFNLNYSDPNTPDVDFRYDDLGLRRAMTDGTGTTLYDYDSLDRLETVLQGDGSEVSYQYDQAGNITKIIHPQRDANETRVISCVYYDDNRLKWVSQFNYHPGDPGFDFEYDPNGNLTRISFPHPNIYDTSIGYDKNNQVISTTTTDNINSLVKLDYTRDSVGLVLSSTEVIGADDYTTSTHVYNYDVLDRLTGDLGTTISDITQTNSVSNTWVYDDASQLKTTISRPTQGSTGEIITSIRAPT